LTVLRPPFVLFGLSHLAMLALALGTPVLLALMAQRWPRLDPMIRIALLFFWRAAGSAALFCSVCGAG